MNTTPLWVPLVVTALGFVGIVVTQFIANRRERKNWDRERKRERERWSREDQARTFEHRRAAYVEFYESLRSMQGRVYSHGSEDAYGPPELEEDWGLDAWEKLQVLELYPTPRISNRSLEEHVGMGATNSAWEN